MVGYPCVPKMTSEQLRRLEREMAARLSTVFDEPEEDQGCNSITILDSHNPRLTHRPIRRLPKRVLNPCLNLRPNSSLKFQMSIELHPRTGLVGMIVNKKIDMSANIGLTQQRQSDINFLWPTFQKEMTLIAKGGTRRAVQ